jgi:enoyl-CoA hydratase/carnithine racemase
VANEINHDFDCKAFSAKQMDEFVLLRFHDKFLLRTNDLSNRDQILGYLGNLSKDPGIKVLVIFGSPEKTGCQEYMDFYHLVMESDKGINAIHRMYNVINQLILAIVRLDKIVIHCNSGKVISSFLNISLACDYRIVADDTVFQNPCLQLGLLPKGGGAFFLQRIIGLSKSYDVLLSEKDISAKEALEMGLVDMMVGKDSLEEAAILKARLFSRKPKSSLTGVKKMLNYSLKDLEEYLNLENQELIRAIMSSEIWKEYWE